MIKNKDSEAILRLLPVGEKVFLIVHNGFNPNHEARLTTPSNLEAKKIRDNINSMTIEFNGQWRNVQYDHLTHEAIIIANTLIND